MLLLRDKIDFRRQDAHGLAAVAIEQAVAGVLDAGIHTADIAVDRDRAVGTAAMGDSLVDLLER